MDEREKSLWERVLMTEIVADETAIECAVSMTINGPTYFGGSDHNLNSTKILRGLNAVFAEIFPNWPYGKK